MFSRRVFVATISASCRRLRHSSSAEELLETWQKILSNRSLRGGSSDQESSLPQMKRLLREAVRIHTQRLGGDVLPEQVTTMFMRAYREAFTVDEKPAFFKLLCNELGLQGDSISMAINNWKIAVDRTAEGAGQQVLNRAAAELEQACRPLYTQLFLPISQQPQGLKFLVDMRSDLLQLLHSQPAYAAQLRTLNDHLRSALAEWFSVGLLQVHRLTWQQTPPAFLEKVMAYEAVHPLDGWGDLKARLGPNRRVYAITHPSMPDEPLVVLYTALMDHTPSSLNEILHQTERTGGASTEVLPGREAGGQSPTVAAFYSISSTQKGLAGVDLGNFLIKRVASILKTELPAIHTFVTLSPLPNFSSWLNTRLLQTAHKGPLAAECSTQNSSSSTAPSTAPNTTAAASSRNGTSHIGLLSLEEAAQVERLAAHLCSSGEAEGLVAATALPPGHAALLLLVKSHRWVTVVGSEEVMQKVLLRLAAVYLLQERRRGLCLDPVANFHLRNGASLHRLLWMADESERGLERSHGLMVNYLYDLSSIATNNRLYMVENKIAASPQVHDLVEGINR